MLAFRALIPKEVLLPLQRAVHQAEQGQGSPDRSLAIRNARFRALRALDVANSSTELGAVAARLAPFLDAALGPHQEVLEYNVMVTAPGAADQTFHSDVANFDSRLASIQLSLVDTEPEQGALEVAPATHRSQLDSDKTVTMAVPAGSITIYSPSLRHRGRANRLRKERRFIGMTLLGTGGVVPAGIPYTMYQHDFGRWSFAHGSLRSRFNFS